MELVATCPFFGLLQVIYTLPLQDLKRKLGSEFKSFV